MPAEPERGRRAKDDRQGEHKHHSLPDGQTGTQGGPTTTKGLGHNKARFLSRIPNEALGQPTSTTCKESAPERRTLQNTLPDVEIS